MGKPNIFEISFANPQGIFYAGQFVEGHVTIEIANTKVLKMRGIRMKFNGKGYVHWTESDNSDDNNSSTTYTANEKYFESEMLLFGIWPGQGSQLTELLPGRHTFPFRFQLLEGIPSSFEALEGHVRYEVTCTIDRPWKFDYKSKRLFSVIRLLDLNSERDYSSPQTKNGQKSICCLCCRSGPITAQVSIGRKGWVPGEAIPIYADISNGSDSRMNHSYAELIMKTTFHASGRHKVDEKSIARVFRPPIAPHAEDTWQGQQLVIPPLTSSFMTGCQLIDVDYELKFVVDPSGLSLKLSLILPIVIGNIPLRSVIQNAPPMPPAPISLPNAQFAVWTNPSTSSGAGDGSYPVPLTPDFNDIPPPSYGECITGYQDVRHDDSDGKGFIQGTKKFAPYCTYYNWGHTPNALPEQKRL